MIRRTNAIVFGVALFAIGWSCRQLVPAGKAVRVEDAEQALSARTVLKAFESSAGRAEAAPERLDFGPFELANPAREARIMVGPDEPEAVRIVFNGERLDGYLGGDGYLLKYR